MKVKLSKAPPPVFGETRLPPILEAEVALALILTDLAIYFPIGRFLLVRVLFHQDCSETFQADPQKMELLSILGEQVELLVKTGRPDLSRFFDSLELHLHSMTVSEEISNLRAKYSLERVSTFLVWVGRIH